MRRYSGKHGLTTLSELNITPLLDLAFVLLIIFMITTPLMENSLDLVVPTSKTADKPVDPGKVQTISIARNLVMKLNSKEIPEADLGLELQRLHAADPGVAVVVRPHKELPVQKFIQIMDMLQKAGISKVGILTLPEEP